MDYLKLYFDEESNNAEETANNEPEDTKVEPEPEVDEPKDEKDELKYSDKDLDAIIEKKMAKWKRQQEKAVDEATKLANMTAQERAEHERDVLQQELDQLKLEKSKAEMEKTARAILQEGGVNVSDTIVSTLIGADAETTSENVKDFIESYKVDVQNNVKAALAHKTPEAGSENHTPTKEEIRKEKNTHKRLEMYREQMGINQ